ncbi:hypothetical protein AMAG_00110 [Allomyces macrogynus ATCC 38327]|uniref:Uncharacterized protein n=1 Tax=Allomyces macrogynus (strain ATCC 38327) TaxID=578462 RepID=A0A0L0RUN6_ALLM3|nr:hypothetical protein AMAG_00110 [Allomyces macrogynus ATCC 38327]|eukprot:KNE54107.1 hypothetical protein AMAG_00110 [Allomyces macrogynus ATCC 38327]
MMLVKRLHILPRLTVLEHHAWHLCHLDALVLALNTRRLDNDVKPLRSLTLSLLQPIELDNLAALSRVESRPTLHIESVDVDFHEWDCFNIDLDVIDRLVRTVIPWLPRGTRGMRVGLPTWEPSWADALGYVLHPDLCHLTMETNGGANDPQTFPFDSMNFPVHLRTLSLHACAYSFGLVTFSTVPQPMRVPATLEQLDLSRNYFSTADLTGLFPHGRPLQLQGLRLDNNFLTQLPRQIPPELRKLSLKSCAQVCEDDDQEAWAASLPLSLRALDMSECGLDDHIVEGLLKWAQKLPRHHARRVHIHVEDCNFESPTIAKRLRKVVGMFDAGYWFD